MNISACFLGSRLGMSVEWMNESKLLQALKMQPDVSVSFIHLPNEGTEPKNALGFTFSKIPNLSYTVPHLRVKLFSII